MAAPIDLTGAVFDKPSLEGAVFDPPAQPRGPLTEIGTGLARGALVGLPQLLGQGLQYTSSPGNAPYELGRSLVDSATQRGQSPALTLQPGAHGMVTNALASGAEMAGAGVAVPLAIGAGAAAAGASPLLAGGAAILGGGALFGAQAGQATLEKAEKAGVAPETAQTAARLNAASTFATQTALGAVGGKLLGVFGKTMGSLFTSEAGPLAESTMQALTGMGSVLGSTLKALPGAAAEAVGLNAAQAAGSAAIEQHYGIDSTSPLDAAKETIGPTLGMTAMLTPLGLVARAGAARSAQARTATLANGESPPEIRAQLAGQYAAALQKVNPEAAGAFRLNANIAIQNKMHMGVDSSLFMPDAITAPPAGPPLLARDPRAGQMVIFPDGTTGFRSDIENYVAGLPEDQQIAARAQLAGYGAQRAAEPPAPPQEPTTSPGATPGRTGPTNPAPDIAAPNWETTPGAAPPREGGVDFTRDIDTSGIELAALHTQVKQGLTEAGLTPAEPLTRKAFAGTDAGKDLKGQGLAKAYKAYLASPDTQRDLMRQDADAYDALQAKAAEQRAAEEAAAGQPRNPPPTETAPPAAPAPTTMADAMAQAMKKRDENAAFAARDAAKAREQDAIQNITRGEQLAQAAERGELHGDPNAPKNTEDLVADWHAAMQANDMDTKAQARVPFEKRIAALGVDKMATHQEQIDALKTIVDDKKASQGMRDRVSMLVNKLEAEQPPKKVEPIPVETTEAAAAKSDTQVAQEPAGTRTGRQAVLDGLEQPGVTREAALEGLHERARAEAADLVAHPDEAKAQALQTKLDHMAAVESEAKARDDADALAGSAPAHAEALGVNIPPKPPVLKGTAPPQAEGLGTNIGKTPDTGARSVSEVADQTADRVASLRADFAQRLRSGEKLSPLEQERYDDLTSAAKAIDKFTEGKASPSDAAHVEFLSDFVGEASQPYTKSKRGVDGVLSKVASADNPEQVSPSLMAPAAISHKASDVLANLVQNGSTQWVRDFAARLLRLLPDTTIWAGDAPGEGWNRESNGKIAGEYKHAANAINIYAPSESTILHETTHAATVERINTAERLAAGEEVAGMTRQDAAQLRSAFAELSAVAERASQLPGAKKQYGLSSPYEFVAELHSNAAFREFLRSNGLWARVVNAVRRLLGMAPAQSDLLERALNASESFFDTDRINRDFDASPASAASSVDATLQRVIASADSDRTPFSKMTEAVFKAVLPLKTVDFIAHQVRGIPELVASGFSRGVDAYQQANTSHRIASEHLNLPGARYVGGLERALREIGDVNKTQAAQREMATIGGEASRVGFDYRKSGKDNLLADKTLNAADKPYMDEMHRRFTQLQKQYPDIAKALEEGERLNRGALINKVATIAANVMDARAGVARRLAAELERMDPADARRAELASQVQAATLESTFAEQFSRALDFREPSLRTAANADPVRFPDGAASTMSKRLDAAFKAAGQLPEGTPLRSHLNALANLYYAQAKNPYFSLGRDGDYFVKVGFKGVDAAANARVQDALKDTNKVVGDLTRGDSHAYFRVDTADEAKALHDKLVVAGQGKVVDTAWGLQTARVNEVSGVAPALRSLLSGLEESVANTPGLQAEQAALMKATITRQILSMLPETASRSASIGRRGVPGYDSNFVNSFARRASAAVNDTAGMYTSRAYAEAAKQRSDAIEQLNRSGSASGRIRAQQVDNEINHRFADNMKPVGNSVVSAATSLSHSFYLGLSPAFFIRTMAQPWHRGIPITGSKFGYVQAMRELAGATPVSMKVIANTIRAAVAKDGARGLIGATMELKGLDLPPREQAFIDELHLRGVLDLGESRQLMMAAEKGSSRGMKDAMRMASVTAQMAEMSNRLVMGLSAFRLAEQRPQLLGKETSTEYAIRAINLAMDNFDPSNTSRAIGRHGFAGPLTPLFTQFQNYALQTMQQIARTTHDGFFGQDKSPAGLQRAAEAKREFAGLMATTAMVSGALGLPFANAFAGVYNNLMSDQDHPEDVRISIRNWAADTFGHDVAGVLLHGPAHALGVDTSTFGLQGILPGSDFLASRMMWKDRSETQARSMLGPAVSLGLDLGEAVSKMSDGYWLKGIEAALPVGLRTYFKTEELARVGYTDSKGNPLPLQAGAADVAWRALGFQTAEKAEQGDAARDFITNQKLLQHRRGVITDEFFKAVNDPSKQEEASQHLQAFNAKNPTQPISGTEIANAIRGHLTSYALGLASGTGVAASKRQYPALVANERFAAMPAP